MIKIARTCIKQGWKIFPVKPGTKGGPGNYYFKEWQNKATDNPDIIEKWWAKWPDANVCIVCGKSGLLVVDIDVKGKANGFDSLKVLQENNKKFPETFMVDTPTGGRHYYFKGDGKNTAGFLGGGIDTRGTRGYVLAPGSKIKKGKYKALNKPRLLTDLPSWLSKLLQKHRTKTETIADVGLDSKQAIERAIDFLIEVPPAVEGQGGDEHTVKKVVYPVKDLGISETMCLQLMLEYFNDRCIPPWDPGELEVKVANGYKYGELPPGISNPEADFDDDDYTPPGKGDRRYGIFPDKDKPEITHEKKKKHSEYAGGRFEDWVYIAKSRIFFNIRTNAELSHTSFEMLWSHKVEGKKAKIVEAIAKHPNMMPKFYNFCYHPNRKRTVIEDGNRLFNLWKDTRIKPVKGNVKWFKEHLLYLCRDRENVMNMVLDWLAWCVQYPEKKLAYSLLIQSVPGCGKTIIGYIMRKIIGDYNISEPTETDLDGAFNTWVKGKQLCIVQELMVDGKMALANKLKQLITEETININEKNRPAYTLSNYMNFLFFTNYVDAAKVEKGDRRYLVILGPKAFKPDAYYTRIWDLAKNGPDVQKNLGAICHFLMNRDLSNFDGQSRSPHTEDKGEMREATMSEVHLFLYELKEAGQYPFNCPLISKERIKSVIPSQFSRYAQKEANKFMREELQCERVGQVYLPKTKDRKCLWVWGDQSNMILGLDAVEQGAIYENALTKQHQSAESGQRKVVNAADRFRPDDFDDDDYEDDDLLN